MRASMFPMQVDFSQITLREGTYALQIAHRIYQDESFPLDLQGG
jgi:hypothetical protein